MEPLNHISKRILNLYITFAIYITLHTKATNTTIMGCRDHCGSRVETCHSSSGSLVLLQRHSKIAKVCGEQGFKEDYNILGGESIYHAIINYM